MLALREGVDACLIRWREDAERFDRYTPNGPVAETLRRCAQDLRQVLDEHEPTWVPIRDVAAATGRSLASLRAICRELEDAGGSRKGRRGWELSLTEAQRIQPCRRSVAIAAGEDLDALARRLGRET